MTKPVANPANSLDESPPLRFSLKALFIAFTVLTVVIGGPFVLIRCALRTVEDAYRAWGTADMLVAYMEANDGTWPKGWNDVRAFMEQNPTQYHTVANFREVREHMEFDFSFDPARVDTTIEFDKDDPAFRAVWLRNGSSAHWEGAEPNEIIYRYLKRARSTLSNATSSPNPQVDDEWGVEGDTHQKYLGPFSSEPIRGMPIQRGD